MNRVKTLMVIVSLIGVSAQAFADNKNSTFKFKIINSSDDINFNIASDLSGSQTPNVLSDLRWDDLEVWHAQASLRYGIGDHFKLIADVGFGLITDGDATDSDFFGDNKTDPFSLATATVDGKHQLSAAVGFGWEFRKQFEKPLWRLGDSSKRIALLSDIRFTPLIGYAYTKHEIEFTDGVQVFPPFGPFDGLNSTYDPEFRGIFLGFDSRVQLLPQWHFIANTKYHYSQKIKATADWNLRSDFAHPESFRHSADADGFDLEVGLEWDFSDDKSIGLSYYHAEYNSDAGTDETITSQGFRFFTRLNEIEWRRRAWSLSFNWRF